MALLMQEYHFLSWGGGGGGRRGGAGHWVPRPPSPLDLALHVDCGIRKGCNRKGKGRENKTANILKKVGGRSGGGGGG